MICTYLTLSNTWPNFKSMWEISPTCFLPENNTNAPNALASESHLSASGQSHAGRFPGH